MTIDHQNTTQAPTGEVREFAKRLRSLASRMAFAMGNGEAFQSLPSDIGRIGSAAALITAQAAEVERLRGVLILAAPHFQGGHSETGKAIAHALGVPFPIRPEALSALSPAQKEPNMTPDELDRARAEEAHRRDPLGLGNHAVVAARLARLGWTPPEPVDPDLLAVREIVASLMEDRGAVDFAAQVRAGARDDDREVKTTLAAYKAGREKERGHG